MHLHHTYDLSFRPSRYGDGLALGERVTIARIAMYEEPNSVALEATLTAKGWRYAFTNPFGWRLAPGRERSRDPLSLGELIASLESARVADGEDAWLMSPICGGFNLLPGDPPLAVQREHLRRATQFPVPASPLYPRLREWYADQHDAWLDRHLIECMELREQA
ncbi:MAG: hypothetical protein HZA61_13715 [Candidatus Eisenbacteria bacterium]|uniref:Uncharacterized protein n=1 Tax=Eiseniibacteriota bacterium TaxID=2212470 RepID=A0A933SFV4_UNCEI|nr:hypothetical protein [Candidatus Eisenbacteria bacterium]